MADMNEWARDLIAGINANREEDAMRSAEFVARRNLIKAFAPSLWEELLKSFRNCCDTINANSTFRLVASQMNSQKFSVRFDGGIKTLDVNRDLNFVVTILGKRYEPMVIARGDGKVVFSNNGQPVECQEIAMSALKLFIDNNW